MVPVQLLLDDVMPGVARTNAENCRWNALPRKERTKRLEQVVRAGFDGTLSKQGMFDRIWLSVSALEDLGLVRERRSEQDVDTITESFRLIAEQPAIGMAIQVEAFECLRYRRDPYRGYDVYYRHDGSGGVVIGRVLDQYFIRKRRSDVTE